MNFLDMKPVTQLSTSLMDVHAADLSNKPLQLVYTDLAQRHFPSCLLHPGWQNPYYSFFPQTISPLSQSCVWKRSIISVRPIVTSLFVWLGDGGIFQFVLQVAGTNNSMKNEWKKWVYNWTLLHQRSNFTVHGTVSWIHLRLDIAVLQGLGMVLVIQMIFGLLITTQRGFTSYALPVVSLWLVVFFFFLYSSTP